MCAAMRATERPRAGDGARRLVGAAAPLRIGHDGLASDFVERDVLRRMARGAGDRHRGEHPVGIGRRPLQHLHAAHRPADHGEQPVDAEMVDQPALQPHHVPDRDDREFQAIGLPGRGVGAAGTGRSHAAAQHVGRNHEIAAGIDRQARPHHHLPPAGLAGDGVLVGHELVAGEGMADQDGVGLLGIQRAVGLIGQGDAGELRPAIERQPPVAELEALAGQIGRRAGGKDGERGHQGSSTQVDAGQNKAAGP